MVICSIKIYVDVYVRCTMYNVHVHVHVSLFHSHSYEMYTNYTNYNSYIYL